MITAMVLTPWVQQDGMYTPQLFADHPLPLGSSYADVTGQVMPHAPNLFVAQIWTSSEDYLNAIEADTRYLIITCEETQGQPA